MTVVADSTSISWSPSNITENPDGSFDATGSRTESGLWAYSWDITAKTDPFITANLMLTNLSASTQTFTLLATLSTSPAFSPAFYGGSVSAVASDANRDGALSFGNSAGIYSGRIDGTAVLNLLAFSSSIGCSITSPPTPPCTLDAGQHMSGLGGDAFTPDGSLSYAAGVSSNISMQLQFSLSAGDSVTFGSLFNVMPVPVPAAAWLLISGIAGLMGAGVVRRRPRSTS
ncbi:MAG TPA: VPLPA-CTERM sorting domain-containing protein [Acidiferrobacterales bacterium]